MTSEQSYKTFRNKLARLVRKKFHPGLTFQGNTLSANIRIGWKCIGVTNELDYCGKVMYFYGDQCINYNCKKFLGTYPKGLYYKQYGFVNYGKLTVASVFSLVSYKHTSLLRNP